MNTIMTNNTLKHLYLAPVKPYAYCRWSSFVGKNINGMKLDIIE